MLHPLLPVFARLTAVAVTAKMEGAWSMVALLADYRVVFVLLTLLSLLTLLQQNVDLLHHQTPRVGQNIFLHSSHVAFVFNVSSLLRYNVSYLAPF